MAFSPALIASIMASICEAVVGDVLPESDCSCVEPELSEDVPVLLIGADDVLMDPVDVSDSVDPNSVLVSVIIELLVGSSEVIVLASGVVLGDDRFDSAGVGLVGLLVGLLGPLVPEVVAELVVLLGPLESLVPEVVVSDWMASSAA